LSRCSTNGAQSFSTVSWSGHNLDGRLTLHRTQPGLRSDRQCRPAARLFTTHKLPRKVRVVIRTAVCSFLLRFRRASITSSSAQHLFASKMEQLFPHNREILSVKTQVDADVRSANQPRVAINACAIGRQNAAILGTEAFGKPVGTTYSTSSRLCTRSGTDIYRWLGMPAGAAMPLMWADAKYIKVKITASR